MSESEAFDILEMRRPWSKNQNLQNAPRGKRSENVLEEYSNNSKWLTYGASEIQD